MRYVDSAFRMSLVGGTLVACAGLAACAVSDDDDGAGSSEQAVGVGYGAAGESSSSGDTSSSGYGSSSGDASSYDDGVGSGTGTGSSSDSVSASTSQCREIDGDPHWVSNHCSGGAMSSFADYTISCSKECKKSTATGKYKCTSTSRAEQNPKAKCE